VREHGLSPYEEEAVTQALTELHATVDPAPEGKRIEQVEVERLEVLEDRDPFPFIHFLNDLHATTLPSVIRREVLVDVGQNYSQALVDETARNLRGLQQLSLVLTLALRGSTPDTVRILIITKDVWSLRLSFNIGFGSGGLEYFLLAPTETNLAGTHQIAVTKFVLDPATMTFGIGYREPRIQGRRLAFFVDQDVIVNRQSGDIEGTTGDIMITRPLYSSRAEWSWAVGSGWTNAIARHFVEAKLANFTAQGETDKIPWEFRNRRFIETASITRSFGWTQKDDFTLGGEVNLNTFETDDLSAHSPTNVQQFLATAVPPSDKRIGPYVEWSHYRTDFLPMLDYETLGLEEDYRMGLYASARAYPVTRVLGSSRNFLGGRGAVQYAAPIAKTGLVRGFVSVFAEGNSDQLYDAQITANLRVASPSFLLGRFVLDGQALGRPANYMHRLDFLGGDTRLRGYPTKFFAGPNSLTYNVEYRSRPLEILKCQLAGVAFYDAGNAFTNWNQPGIHHSLGVGARVLIPQLDREVFRVDVGFPVGPRPGGIAPAAFFVTFDQAFPSTTISPTSPTNAVLGLSAGALGQ
jgi:hypothetical protein